MVDEWNVLKIFATDFRLLEKIDEAVQRVADLLMKKGDLKDFSYNIYFIADTQGVVKIPPHMRYSFYNLKDEKMILDKVEELKKEGLVSKVEKSTPDLRDADGIPIERIKLTSRKIAELVKTDLGKGLTPTQAYYLIHLAMNALLGYVNERETYLLLTASMEDAIRKHKILPREKWLSFLDEYLEKNFPKGE